MKSSLLLVAAALLVVACKPSTPPAGEHWRQIGQLNGGAIRFVEIDTASAQDGATYKEAIDEIRASGRAAQIGFFLEGDRMPPSPPPADFFQTGGWGQYSPVAVYTGDEFTRWDCERAGVKDAPASALCGKGAKEE